MRSSAQSLARTMKNGGGRTIGTYGVWISLLCVPSNPVISRTLFMLYKGQPVWDTKQDFGKNKGQSLAFSKRQKYIAMARDAVKIL